MTAGIWCLDRFKPKLYRNLAALGACLAAGLADAAREAGVALQVNAVGSVSRRSSRTRPWATTVGHELKYRSYARFFRAMLNRGVYPPPSQFEAWFLSAAHTVKDVDKTIAARGAMREVGA